MVVVVVDACRWDALVEDGGVGLAADGTEDAAAFGDFDAHEEVESYCGEDGGPDGEVNVSW